MRNADPSIQRLVPSWPPIAILGVPFDNVTASEAVAGIEQMVASRHPHYLVTANVDFLVQAQTDVELRRILMEAHMVLCDGTPLVWASRILGNRLPERVAGSDLVPILLRVAARKGYRVFLLGATPEAVEEAAKRIQRDHPSLHLAGHYSPPFKMLLRMDHEEIKRRIHEAQPDLLFVAFGCPKAEKWISMHYRDLAVPVVIGVGATIDFLAGRVKRAPRWMQHGGLEWVYRMACEPRRLFKRYMKDLWVFGRRMAWQWWVLECRPWLLRQRSKKRTGRWWDVTHNVGRHCIMDLTGLSFVDSTDVGLLLKLQKKLHEDGRHFILVSVSPGVQRALESLRLKDHFDLAADKDGALRLIEERTSEQSALVAFCGAGDRHGLKWCGEITAANAGQFLHDTKEMMSRSAKHVPVEIDLSGARFIDSSGLTVMLRTQQWAWRQGTKLVFTGAQAPLRKVLRQATLEQLLLEKPELNGLTADFLSASQV